ncbi:MAG: hypothetical protein JXR70_08305 [Spirochaetales bacterium]|nr:hypothetical protein [Spirochaetales bacterium]
MGFDFMVKSPYFWFVLVAFFSALALLVLVKKKKKKENQTDEEYRNKKLIKVLVFLSLALVFFICSLIIPGVEKIKDIYLLYFYAILVFFFFLALKFKKAFGIPAFILAIVAVSATIMFIQSLRAFTGETEIAKIRVLNMENSSMVLDIDFPDSEDKRFVMKGNYFTPHVKVVILDDFYVFFGAKTLYRFVGMETYIDDEESEMQRQVEIVPFETPMGISREIYRFFMDNESWLPGIKAVQVEGPRKKAVLLQSYSLRVQYDGGVEITLIE